MKYEVVIGLEVHTELQTTTKIFCSCKTSFGADPNTNVCPVCLGLPGVLPVLNKKVLEYAVRAGLALNCEISRFSKFDRKTIITPTFRRTSRPRSLTCRSVNTATSMSKSTAK